MGGRNGAIAWVTTSWAPASLAISTDFVNAGPEAGEKSEANMTRRIRLMVSLLAGTPQ